MKLLYYFLELLYPSGYLRLMWKYSHPWTLPLQLRACTSQPHQEVGWYH